MCVGRIYFVSLSTILQLDFGTVLTVWYFIVFHFILGARVAQRVRSLDLTAHTSLSPIWHGFVPSFVNYKKGCTRLAAASD